MSSVASVGYINVTAQPKVEGRAKSEGGKRPDHWADDKGSAFVNPWPSFIRIGVSDMLPVCLLLLLLVMFTVSNVLLPHV